MPYPFSCDSILCAPFCEPRPCSACATWSSGEARSKHTMWAGSSRAPTKYAIQSRWIVPLRLHGVERSMVHHAPSTEMQAPAAQHRSQEATQYPGGQPEATQFYMKPCSACAAWSLADLQPPWQARKITVHTGGPHSACTAWSVASVPSSAGNSAAVGWMRTTLRLHSVERGFLPFASHFAQSSATSRVTHDIR